MNISCCLTTNLPWERLPAVVENLAKYTYQQSCVIHTISFAIKNERAWRHARGTSISAHTPGRWCMRESADPKYILVRTHHWCISIIVCCDWSRTSTMDGVCLAWDHIYSGDTLFFVNDVTLLKQSCNSPAFQPPPVVFLKASFQSNKWGNFHMTKDVNLSLCVYWCVCACVYFRLYNGWEVSYLSFASCAAVVVRLPRKLNFGMFASQCC